MKLSKVSDKGLVTIPLEIRRKLGLTPGTKMVLIATEDAVVLRKGMMLFDKGTATRLLSRIRAMGWHPFGGTVLCQIHNA